MGYRGPTVMEVVYLAIALLVAAVILPIALTSIATATLTSGSPQTGRVN